MIRSFTYSALAEQSLEWLQKATEMKNKNQLFEPMVISLLRATISAPELGQKDREDGLEILRAWDQIKQAEGLRSAGVQRPDKVEQ